MDSMKTTVDIPDDELKEALEHTGAKTKRQAVVTALADYNRRQRLARLAARFGTLERFMTHHELNTLRRDR